MLEKELEPVGSIVNQKVERNSFQSASSSFFFCFFFWKNQKAKMSFQRNYKQRVFERNWETMGNMQFMFDFLDFSTPNWLLSLSVYQSLSQSVSLFQFNGVFVLNRVHGKWIEFKALNRCKVRYFVTFKLHTCQDFMWIFFLTKQHLLLLIYIVLN